jgi:hypothetical protein
MYPAPWLRGGGSLRAIAHAPRAGRLEVGQALAVVPAGRQQTQAKMARRAPDRAPWEAESRGAARARLRARRQRATQGRLARFRQRLGLRSPVPAHRTRRRWAAAAWRTGPRACPDPRLQAAPRLSLLRLILGRARTPGLWSTRSHRRGCHHPGVLALRSNADTVPAELGSQALHSIRVDSPICRTTAASLPSQRPGSVSGSRSQPVSRPPWA